MAAPELPSLAWELLADSSDLGIQQLPESWWEAERACPDQPPSEQLARAEEAITALLAAGYIELYRYSPKRQPMLISPADGADLLSDRRSWTSDGEKVWYCVTPAGDTALDALVAERGQEGWRTLAP
jgi:hypothetical protein